MGIGLLYADMSDCYSQLCHILINPHVTLVCAWWLPCPLEDMKKGGQGVKGGRGGGEENTRRVRLGTGSGKGNGRKCVPTT